MPEKKWVFDTVVLSNFLLSDSAYVLAQRYGKRGIVTWEVFHEIASGFRKFPELETIRELIRNETFILRSLSTTEHERFLELIRHLGKGEASCIALAGKRNHVVMTDDRAARTQCFRIGILFSGTIGILKASWRDGQITLEQADSILHRMINRGFYSPVRNISDIA